MKLTIFSTQNQNAHMSTYQALRTKTKIFIFVKIEIVNIFILNLLKKHVNYNNACQPIFRLTYAYAHKKMHIIC